MKFLQEIGSAFDPVRRSLEANVAKLAQADQRPIGSAVAAITEKSRALVRKVFQL
jgi:hypothetical protein